MSNICAYCGEPGVGQQDFLHEKCAPKYLAQKMTQDNPKADTELDAIVNDGLLVEVCRILGKPIYVRIDHHDPELAKHELAEIRSIVKDVVIGDD